MSAMRIRGNMTLWCDQLMGEILTIRNPPTATCESTSLRRFSWCSSAAKRTMVASTSP